MMAVSEDVQGRRKYPGASRKRFEATGGREGTIEVGMWVYGAVVKMVMQDEAPG